MSDQETLYPIHYFEYRVINELVHRHAEQLGKGLRAVIAFGEIKTHGDTYDIDLLEVVEDWEEKDRVVEFDNTSLPMRGKLRLYFLTANEFENTDQIKDAAMRRWVQSLLKRVREGYEIVLEYPGGYARNVLKRSEPVSVWTAPASGVLHMTDPYKIPIKRK